MIVGAVMLFFGVNYLKGFNPLAKQDHLYAVYDKIEGLAVSIFARESIIPAADTQMQMQRWFGYRGKILPLCRIFVHSNQLQLFRQYHQSDKSLKERISKIERQTPIHSDIPV